jgi:hypothetical protein
MVLAGRGARQMVEKCSIKSLLVVLLNGFHLGSNLGIGTMQVVPPSPPVVYWHHGVRRKLQSNLWRTMTYAQNPDFKELASRVDAVNRTASALAIICLVPGRRKGRCHNRTVEMPVRTTAASDRFAAMHSTGKFQCAAERDLDCFPRGQVFRRAKGSPSGRHKRAKIVS